MPYEQPRKQRIGLPSASLKSYSMSVLSPIVEEHIYLIVKVLDDFALRLPSAYRAQVMSLTARLRY